MGRPAARVLEAIKFATMRPTHPFTMTIQRNPGRLIAVGGGKGGVGKSVVSSNLAIAIAARSASWDSSERSVPQTIGMTGLYDEAPGACSPALA